RDAGLDRALLRRLVGRAGRAGRRRGDRRASAQRPRAVAGQPAPFAAACPPPARTRWRHTRACRAAPAVAARGGVGAVAAADHAGGRLRCHRRQRFEPGMWPAAAGQTRRRRAWGGSGHHLPQPRRRGRAGSGGPVVRRDPAAEPSVGCAAQPARPVAGTDGQAGDAGRPPVRARRPSRTPPAQPVGRRLRWQCRRNRGRAGLARPCAGGDRHGGARFRRASGAVSDAGGRVRRQLRTISAPGGNRRAPCQRIAARRRTPRSRTQHCRAGAGRAPGARAAAAAGRALPRPRLAAVCATGGIAWRRRRPSVGRRPGPGRCGAGATGCCAWRHRAGAAACAAAAGFRAGRAGATRRRAGPAGTGSARCCPRHRYRLRERRIPPAR
ncbi:hypothetical protein XPN_1700, partial [Xanthomonas arboricola pv. pruni MAFF 301427]